MPGRYSLKDFSTIALLKLPLALLLLLLVHGLKLSGNYYDNS
jgi:hypothetical protein